MGEIRIYTDESVDVAIAEGLQRRGIDAFSARDLDNLSLTDEEQLIFARQEKATIFSHDTDFLRIAAQWKDEGRKHCGVIYCHQIAYGIGDCIRNLKILATVLTSEDMINHFVVILGKANFDLTHEFGETGQLFTKIGDLALNEFPAVAIKFHIPLLNLVIRKMVFRNHFHQQMEVIAHQAKAQNFSKIQR